MNENKEFYGRVVEINEESFESLSDFEESLLDRLNSISIVDCELRDLNIVSESDDKNFIQFKIANDIFNISHTGLKALCKVLKIPVKFASSISLSLFVDAFEELKLQYNKEIKLIVTNSIIVNVVAGRKEYAERYIEHLLQYFKQSHKELQFHSAVMSEIGYRINFITPEKTDKDSIWIDNTEYRMGLSFSGDIFRLKPFFEVDYFQDRFLS